MSNLLASQFRFAKMLQSLLAQAMSLGLNVSVGETYRTKEQAAHNAAAGIGIKNSLHCDRLAIDLNLFQGQELFTRSAQYEPLGRYWESLGGNWGGRFDDPAHFSLSPTGDTRK